MTTSDLVQECDDGQLPGDDSYYGRDHVDPAGTHSYNDVLRTEPVGVGSDTKNNTDDKKGLADTEQILPDGQLYFLSIAWVASYESKEGQPVVEAKTLGTEPTGVSPGRYRTEAQKSKQE